ncbi:MAG TPA: hypothetical protein VJH20_01185 [Candidatus Nanoarchaeia archaeon]|nr:hypothetical protein [Candidatus Nanoarchaeia archaeon]
MVEDEGTNLEEFTIGHGEPTVVLPKPLELLAQMNVILDVSDEGPGVLRVASSLDKEISHVGPSKCNRLSLEYHRVDRDIGIEYDGNVLSFKLFTHRLISVHCTPSSMPGVRYQEIKLSDYNRRLNELRESRTGGAGSEV